VKEVGVMNAVREDVFRNNAAQQVLALCKSAGKLLRVLLSVVVLALPATNVFAQGNPIMPKFSLQGDQKRPLTPEEKERQKRLDAEYKAATSKIPDQKRGDPWADVRPAPSASASKKKQ
jgi:hypothetical protein